jgi:uncharacterized protein (DUF58 family)
MPEAAPQPDTLLTPSFMRQLDRLDVRSRKMLRGTVQGERRSKKRGASVEFADYRNYVVGDDLRRIDWNLYARLDKLFLRLFMEEEDLSVSLVLDATASMDYGDPRKSTYAKQMVAALGYIALTHYNRLNLYRFTDTIVGSAEGLRGRRPIPRMVEWLGKSPATRSPGYVSGASTRRSPGSVSGASGGGDLAEACRRFAVLNQRPGVVVLISDFFDKGDLSDALRYLAGDRYDTYAIQLLSPQEVDPTKAGVVGDLRLTDLEDGDTAEVSISAALLKKYRANLEAYCQHVKEVCTKRGLMYLAATTDVPVEKVVLQYLRERGLVG